MKIALYGCNFGNYRNELKKGIDHIKVDKEIDCYFYTDNHNLKSKMWKIIIYDKTPTDSNMDSNRWTSKNVKFVLPDILKEYDIVIWCDSKIIASRKVNITVKKIKNLFLENNYKLFNIKHKFRTTLQEELVLTMKTKIENKINGKIFLDKIKDINFTMPLVDTCFIIRKTDDLTNTLFENVYQLLKDNGIKRDQNIYSYAMYNMDYPIENVSIINMDWLSL